MLGCPATRAAKPGCIEAAAPEAPGWDFPPGTRAVLVWSEHGAVQRLGCDPSWFPGCAEWGRHVRETRGELACALLPFHLLSSPHPLLSSFQPLAHPLPLPERENPSMPSLLSPPLNILPKGKEIKAPCAACPACLPPTSFPANSSPSFISPGEPVCSYQRRRPGLEETFAFSPLLKIA